MAININTDSVRSAAGQIASMNKALYNDFSAVESAINNLDRNWSGNAANLVIGKFFSIKKMFCDNRYAVIGDMVNFMYNQVGEGYDTTEKGIKSATSAFK